MPFDVIVDNEGGPGRPSSILAATKYISKAAKMGGAWCHCNQLTESWGYLYIRKQHIDVFSKAWAHHEEYAADPGAELQKGKRTLQAAVAKHPLAITRLILDRCTAVFFQNPCNTTVLSSNLCLCLAHQTKPILMAWPARLHRRDRLSMYAQPVATMQAGAPSGP